jgi:hypothetical protein
MVAVVFDGDLLETVEVAQGVLPLGLDIGFVAAGLKFLS